MTWSRTAAGSPADVIDKAERWGVEVDALNVTAELVVDVRAGQQRQVARVVEALKAFADRVPAGYQLRVTAGGYAGTANEADHWYCNLGAYLPVPVAAK